ncbi:MAG: adenosine kinase [Woeseiaceae bacterium]
MTEKTDLLGISNAIVDVLTEVPFDELEKLGAPAGSMTLIDQARAVELYELMSDTTESAGGSVANSVACFASLGGRASYIGRVADDTLGNTFAQDMSALGIDLRLPAETREAPTARCHVFITPDGERTMQTFLGACVEIAETDITEQTVGQPNIMLLEGYVWDTPEGPASMSKAIAIAKATGTRIALSLSDSFCVERHQAAYETLAAGDADIVIGNEAETLQLFRTTSLDDAVAKAAASGKLFVITRSERGSIIIDGDQRHDQSADLSQAVKDATGAGDAYVAGFLYGVANDWTHAKSAELATRCATLTIAQVGARPNAEALVTLLG